MAGDTPEVTSSMTAHGDVNTKHKKTDSLISESNIIEIRQDREELDLLKDIKTGLRPANGRSKSLPTLLLYDEAGLKLFEKITYLDEYYLTNAEIEVLKNCAGQIAERIKPNSIVLELGSGYVDFYSRHRYDTDNAKKSQKDQDPARRSRSRRKGSRVLCARCVIV